MVASILVSFVSLTIGTISRSGVLMVAAEVVVVVDPLGRFGAPNDDLG